MIGAIETNNTFIATNNIINQAEAAAGVLITGTVSGSNIVGQTVTVDIVNASYAVIESFTTTVHPNGTWSVDVTPAQAQGLADGIYTVTASIPPGAGGNPATASQTVTLDQDLSEHPSVLVDDGSTTPIGKTGASAVALAINGLAADDNGTLTFSDGTHSVTVTIADGQVVAGENNTTTTVNLSGLADDRRSPRASRSPMRPATASGHWPRGDARPGSGEQAGLTVAFNFTLIGGPSRSKAQSTAVHFTVGGLDTDDTAVITFTDHNGKTVTDTVTANGETTVNCSRPHRRGHHGRDEGDRHRRQFVQHLQQQQRDARHHAADRGIQHV